MNNGNNLQVSAISKMFKIIVITFDIKLLHTVCRIQLFRTCSTVFVANNVLTSFQIVIVGVSFIY